MNGIKNDFMQVTSFLNGRMVNSLFYCHIISYSEKKISYEKYNQYYEVWLIWKISTQVFNAIDGWSNNSN